MNRADNALDGTLEAEEYLERYDVLGIEAVASIAPGIAQLQRCPYSKIDHSPLAGAQGIAKILACIFDKMMT